MTKSLKRVLPLALACALWPGFSALAEEVPFSDPRWEFTGEKTEIVTIDGREALAIFNGRASLPDAGFENGVIEFDIIVTPERGFHGVFFRNYEGRNGEFFYIRPHQSGMEDANQYTPLFNGLTAWQLYFGPQFSAPTAYRFGEWIHIKLVVSDNLMDVYIDSDEPVLTAALKNHAGPGSLILSSGFAPAHFANFLYERQDNPVIVGTPAPSLEPEAGVITSWEVSSPFDEGALEGVTTLDPDHLDEFAWRTLAVEEKGYANLSRVTPFGEGSNTVFARLNIMADEETIRPLRFGYSDRVKVFLNGELLYSGSNGYQTRDYRYLGTIGLFDEVPLHLKAGESEVLFAVSESFGGWGVMAKLDNREGVRLQGEE